MSPFDSPSLIYALAEVLDLVGIDDVGHGRRVGIMAAQCGIHQGLDSEASTFLFDLGLLHDIGVSSTQVHHNLLATFDWPEAQTHCDLGFARLQGFGPLQPFAIPVRHHHTPWTRLQELALDPSLAWQANLIYLVDRVDALALPHHAQGDLLTAVTGIREAIRRRSGTTFSPELVALFLAASSTEAFWLRLEPRAAQEYLLDMQRRNLDFAATPEALRRLAQIFSDLLDAKSPCTVEHSQGVAGVARLLAERQGLSEASCTKVEIAGLLHDIGKLRVPEEILEKPGGLDAQEREIINTHSFETFQILRQVHGFEEIAPWTAYHHEEPEGRGYPFHLDALTLPIEARLLRVADIFQAMVQDRPYRPGLTFAEALAFLDDLVLDGRLEPQLVDLVRSCGDEAMAAALPGRQPAAS